MHRNPIHCCNCIAFTLLNPAVFVTIPMLLIFDILPYQHDQHQLQKTGHLSLLVVHTLEFHKNFENEAAITCLMSGIIEDRCEGTIEINGNMAYYTCIN